MFTFGIHIKFEVIHGRSTITDHFAQEGLTLNLYKLMVTHHSSIYSIVSYISDVIKIRHLISFSAPIIVGLAFMFSALQSSRYPRIESCIMIVVMLIMYHCTVVEGGDKTYLVTFEYWFKFGLFGCFWVYFDRIQALNYF